jgi:SAM-dependent methyltransferase
MVGYGDGFNHNLGNVREVFSPVEIILVNQADDLISMTADVVSYYEEKYSTAEEVLRTYHLECLKFLPDSTAKVLDLGSGSGKISRLIESEGHEVVALDCSKQAVRKSKQRGIASLRANLNRDLLPFSTGSFDVVWCSDLIEHVFSLPKLTKEIHRVLKKGGTWIITVPNSGHFVFRCLGLLGRMPPALQDSGHVSFFTEHSLRQLIASRDFEIHDFYGRNLYIGLKNSWLPDWCEGSLETVLKVIGLHKEYSPVRGEDLWVKTTMSPYFNSLFSDEFIVRLKKM